MFCGVFDGHGPSGHKVARHARELLPSKLSKAIKKQPSRLKNGVSEASVEPDNNGGNQQNPFVSRWEAAFEESFKEFDQDLGFDSSIDCFCSGTTAVTIIKQVNTIITTTTKLSWKITSCVSNFRGKRQPFNLLAFLIIRESIW